jgi:NAD(P)-dependent dehydrogenase (short-subunit alcohol dehydrogenase family)
MIEPAGPGRPGRLAGKVAVVTGAGSLGNGLGNGKAASLVFAREGAAVFAVDRTLEAAQHTVDLITADGGTAVACQADVSREEDVARLVEECVATLGSVGVLLNNVGIGVVGGVADATLRSWELVQRVNLTSMFLTTRAFAPMMAGQGGGAIVNVSSVASVYSTGTPFVSYSVSKAGVNQLTRVTAAEFARSGVRCNAVVPGLMDTPTVYAGLAADEADAGQLRAERSAMCPMGHMGDAWDVAHAALYLASDEAKYVTGALLVVDGGLSLGR